MIAITGLGLLERVCVTYVCHFFSEFSKTAPQIKEDISGKGYLLVPIQYVYIRCICHEILCVICKYRFIFSNKFYEIQFNFGYQKWAEICIILLLGRKC